MNYKTIGLLLASLFFLQGSASAAGAASSAQHEIIEDDVVLAVRDGNLGALQHAINSGFDPNYCVTLGVSLLILAVIQKHVSLVEYLVSLEDESRRRIVDSEVCDVLNKTALDYACTLKADTPEDLVKKQRLIEILKAVKPRIMTRRGDSVDGSLGDLPGFDRVESSPGSGRTSRAAQSPVPGRYTPIQA